MPPLAVLPVNQRRVLRDAVVPDHDGAGLPLDARLEVGAVREVVVQELEEGVRLLLLEADDVAGDLTVVSMRLKVEVRGGERLTLVVDIDSLFARCGMGADNRVFVDDGLASLDAAPCSGGVDLFNTRVSSLETMKSLLEKRTQSLVCSDGINKESVTTSIRSIQDVQEGSARGLLLI